MSRLTYDDLKKNTIKDLHNNDLIRQCKVDNMVLQDFLLANKEFIFSIIIKFKGSIEDIKKKFNVDEEELLQHAYIAMITAIRDFDLNRGIKFTTYVVRPIIWEINQLLYSNSRLVKLSRGAIDLLKRIKSIEDRNGFLPSEDDIAEELNMSKKRINEVLRFTKELEHFQANNIELSDENAFNEEQIVNKVFLEELIENFNFTETELRILDLIKKGKNNSQIADILNVYPMTINRTITRIRNKILNSDNTFKKCSKYNHEVKIVTDEMKEKNKVLNIDEVKELLDVCGFDVTEYTLRILYYIRQKAMQETGFTE